MRAFITGTSAGLGRAIAVALAREGYDQALTELSTDALKDTLADPALANRKAVPVALDLRSQDSIKAAFERATKELGDIDLLVNNAGRALLKPVVDVTDAEWDDVIDTNLKGAFFLSQLFGRDCIAKGRPGVIVSMASTHGLTGIAGPTPCAPELNLGAVALSGLALRVGRGLGLRQHREAAGVRNVRGVGVVRMAGAGQKLAVAQNRVELGEGLDLVRRQPLEQM